LLALREKKEKDALKKDIRGLRRKNPNLPHQPNTNLKLLIKTYKTPLHDSDVLV
jgi:hypothetical protein